MSLRERRRASTGKLELLSRVSLFEESSREELIKIAALFDEVWQPAGTVLVKEGRPGFEFFVIVEGEASALQGGKEIARLGAGDFFGEMSLLEMAPRSATVVAATDVSLLVAEPRGFAALWSAAPMVGVRMMRTMSGRLRAVETAAERR